MSKRILISTAMAISALLSMIGAATHDFVPDHVFKGSSLEGWRRLGHADWQAANGEITAKPKDQDGGWLVLDKSYQDVELFTEFRCADPCKAGVLFRAEKTSDGGLKGILVSLSNADLDSYDVVLSPEGKEVSRNKLDRATAQFARMAAGPWANGQAHVPGLDRKS